MFLVMNPDQEPRPKKFPLNAAVPRSVLSPPERYWYPLKIPGTELPNLQTFPSPPTSSSATRTIHQFPLHLSAINHSQARNTDNVAKILYDAHTQATNQIKLGSIIDKIHVVDDITMIGNQMFIIHMLNRHLQNCHQAVITSTKVTSLF